MVNAFAMRTKAAMVTMSSVSVGLFDLGSVKSLEIQTRGFIGPASPAGASGAVDAS